jgi:hypothetical protein
MEKQEARHESLSNSSGQMCESRLRSKQVLVDHGPTLPDSSLIKGFTDG